jgi:glycosyltransferase involved in cell wall biosynthesis
MKYNLKKKPSKIEFLLPKSKSFKNEQPEISIVVPALNEELTIGEFVDWCWEGLKKAKVKGEIIIVDSSSDDTPNIALAKGAKVLRTPKRGLGQAYIDVIPFIRGDFIIMGDCDLTYDFREVKVFIDSYKKGNEFVMGSRFTGSIEDGAMPALHRYFGTPLTTWILNRIYHSRYSDIHCGMRGLTKNALFKINLTSKGWEYASEMVLKASRIGLRIDEVPVNFYKDREGRFSHHKRAGFWSPWNAGWINLKVMLVYSPDTFLIKPGLLLLLVGLIITILSITGNFFIGRVGFGTNMQLLGFVSLILGISFLQVAMLARYFHQLRKGFDLWFLQNISYNKGMIVSGIFFFSGFILDVKFFLDYLSNNFIARSTSSSLLGLLFIVISIQFFIFTLLLEMIRRLLQK